MKQKKKWNSRTYEWQTTKPKKPVKPSEKQIKLHPKPKDNTTTKPDHKD